MTRQEWFDEQTPKVQRQFKENCNTLNSDNVYFDYWINQAVELTEGIKGAFTWSLSGQGHDYWLKINHKYLNDAKNE